MSQKLELEIKATSDVDKATQKAKNEVGSFAHAIDAFGRKFKNFGKDLLLSVAGPMAVLNKFLDYAQQRYEESKRMATEGLALLAEGKSKLGTTQESVAAEFFRRKQEMEDERKLIAAGREKLALEFLKTEEGQKMRRELPGGRTMESDANLAYLPFVQKRAVEAFMKSAEGLQFQGMLDAEKKAKERQEKEKAISAAKSQQLTGNVIGVGATANFTILQSQLEVQKESRDLLRAIASPGRSVNPTVKASATPSR